uniref:Brinker DNA-binding domain-containing protein n=1 Tax=Anopheles minimus TaxID=112268 RepID=A0A182WFW1_9DIPT
MAHGSLTVAGQMVVKSESSGRTGAAAGSSSPSATAAHNSAKMGSRRIFTPQFKLQVLDSYRNDGDCKGNQRATARKYGIHRRQIQKWLQVENNLRSVVANGGGSGSSNSHPSGSNAAGTGSSSTVATHSNSAASSTGNGASMKINLLNHHHHHHHQHHPAHYLHQLSDPAPSSGDTVNQTHHHHHQQQQQQQSVIFSPVPLLAAPSSVGGANDTHYYGHIRAVAAAAQAAAAAAVTAAAATAHRYDHPIDLSRPGSQSAGLSPVPSCPQTPYDQRHEPPTVKEEQVECEDEEISVEDEPSTDCAGGVMEQAWDLSCRRLPERKRSSSAMSGPIVTPDTSRPPKSVKLFKPYLLDEKPEDKGVTTVKQQRPDSALADDDKDSTRESPAIVERPMSPGMLTARHPSLHHPQQYPIIWSNSSPAYYEQHAYELSPPAYLLAAQSSQATGGSVGGAPTGTVPAGRGWSSPQASPVSGYDSSTSISSICSGPEEDNTSHSSSTSSHGSHGESEKLKQQAIDSFYHDVACRGDYRAVATKYNINRKYVEKWLQQEQEDDHHHHHHHHHHHAEVIATPSAVRSPLVVG